MRDALASTTDTYYMARSLSTFDPDSREGKRFRRTPPVHELFSRLSNSTESQRNRTEVGGA